MIAERLLAEAMKHEHYDAAVSETLGAVQVRRRDEADEEQSKLTTAEEERRQLVCIGEGLLYAGSVLVDGTWDFPVGSIMLKVGSTGIEGNADVEYQDALAAILFAGVPGAPRTGLKRRRISLDGELFGRVWKYVMTVETGKAGDLVMQSETTKSHSGVIVFDDQWTSGEMIEIKDGRISTTVQIGRC